MLALAAAGTALSVIGNIREGRANRDAAFYQAAVAERNRQAAEGNAQHALQVGQIDQQELDFENLAAMGTAETIQGSSGTAVSGRSARNTRAVASRLARLDALRIREGAQADAYNFRTAALGFGEDAKMLRRTGRSALVSGFLNAGSSLVTGAARVGRIRNLPDRASQFQTLLT